MLYNVIYYALQGICWIPEKTSKLSPIHSITQFVTDFYGDQAEKNLKRFQKKFQNGRFKKNEFFKIVNSQFFL